MLSPGAEKEGVGQWGDRQLLQNSVFGVREEQFFKREADNAAWRKGEGALHKQKRQVRVFIGFTFVVQKMI